MPTLGSSYFSEYGELSEVPSLQDVNGFQFCKIVLIVRTKNTSDGKLIVDEIPIVITNTSVAKKIVEYGVAGAFYQVSGTIRVRKWEKDGKQYSQIELRGTEVVGGP